MLEFWKVFSREILNTTALSQSRVKFNSCHSRGCENHPDTNNGLFNVLSHVGTLLTIKGVGLTPTGEIFQDNFVTDTTVAGKA